MRSGGPFKKSLVRAYHRHTLSGTDVYVPAHQRATPQALVDLLIKQHDRQPEGLPPAPRPGAPTAPAASLAAPSAAPAPAEAPEAPQKAAKKSQWKGLSGQTAELLQQRQELENDHAKLTEARTAEQQTAAASDPQAKTQLGDRAKALRANLQTKYGRQYENNLERQVIENHAREIEREANRWGHRMHGGGKRGTMAAGDKDLLHTEATTAAWMTLRRRSAENTQGLTEALQSGIRQYLTRNWRRTFSGDAVALSVRKNEALQKIAKFQDQYLTTHEELPEASLIAAKTGMSEQQVGELLDLQSKLFGQSLQSPNEEGETLEDHLASPEPTPEEQVEAKDTAAVVQGALRDMKDPLRRALVMVDSGMPLDVATVAEVIHAERLPELAVANYQARAQLGPDATEAQVAESAVQRMQWPEGTKMEQKRAAAAQLLRFDNKPERVLTDDYLHPHTGTLGSVTPAELYRRLGYSPKDASQSIKTGLAQLRKHPAMVALEDAMVKALDFYAPTGLERLLRNLALVDAQEPLVTGGMLGELWKSLTDMDPLTGTRTVRPERHAEAALLRAVMAGENDATVYSEGDRSALYERVEAGRPN